MNSELKAVLQELADILVTVETAPKGLSALIPVLIKDGSDVPAIVANWSDWMPELQALVTNPAADADLLAYVAGLVAGETAKAQGVIAAIAKLVLDVASDIGGLVVALKA